MTQLAMIPPKPSKLQSMQSPPTWARVIPTYKMDKYILKIQIKNMIATSIVILTTPPITACVADTGMLVKDANSKNKPAKDLAMIDKHMVTFE